MAQRIFGDVTVERDITVNRNISFAGTATASGSALNTSLNDGTLATTKFVKDQSYHSGTLGLSQGGTGLTTTTGITNKVIGGVSGDGALEYKALVAGTGASIDFTAGTITFSAAGTGGTVTSVGLALPAEFAITGSPVSVSGTLTGGWATQTANKVFASPNSTSGLPSFRALVNGDLPSSGISAGTYAGITFNDRGIATTATGFSSSDVNTALGYTAANDANVVHLAGTETITGAKTFSTGTSVPFAVTSTLTVTNLNADLLDGQHGSYYAPISSPTFTGTPLITTTPTAGDNSHKIADTAFVANAIGTAITSGIVYKGTGDITAAPPSSPATGDLYRITTGGTPNVGYTFSTTVTLVDVGDYIVYNGTNWDRQSNINPSVTAGTGITVTPTGDTSFAVAITNQITAGGPTGTSSVVPVISWNAQGQLTTVSTATITPSAIGAASDSAVVHNTGNETITGIKTFNSLAVSNSTIVTNLNADLLDGQHGSYYNDPANLSSAVGTSKGGTGLSSIGTANQILGANNDATGLEYKTITAGTGISVSHATNSVTIASTKYTTTFNATTDWGSNSGGYYTITITAATHGRGTSPLTQVFQTVATDNDEVMVDRIRVASNGDVSFRVPDSPDLRFAGKVVIL